MLLQRMQIWLTRNVYEFIIFIVGVFCFMWFELSKESMTVVVPFTGAFISGVYFIQKQKLERIKLFREIFKECNSRYDEMNDQLVRIAEYGQPVEGADKVVVIDYLNLCGEEYLYFKLGYIEKSVWQAWFNGMKSVISAPNINKVWVCEKETSSYYDLPL